MPSGSNTTPQSLAVTAVGMAHGIRIAARTKARPWNERLLLRATSMNASRDSPVLILLRLGAGGACDVEATSAFSAAGPARVMEPPQATDVPKLRSRVAANLTEWAVRSSFGPTPPRSQLDQP